MTERIRICGMDVSVRYGNELDHPDLKGTYGCYDRDTYTLWLHKDTPKDKNPFWKTHEALHALVENSGAVYVTAAIFGVKREDPRVDAWEEAIIRLLVPHFLETFGPPRRIR